MSKILNKNKSKPKEVDRNTRAEAPTMETVKDLRRELKGIGFKVSIRSYSHGPHATFIHTESEEKLTFNVFTPEQRKRWKPFFEWQHQHMEELRHIAINEYADCRIYGLIPS